MPGTLTARLIALLLLAVVAVTGAYDLWRLQAERAQLVERMQAEVRILAETLAAAVRPLLARRRLDEVRALVDRVAAFPEISRITLYDAEQTMVATALAAQAPVGDTEGELLALAAGRGEPFGEFYGEGPGQVYQYVFPVAAGRRAAYLEVVYPWARAEAQIQEQQRAILVTRGAILLAMGLAFWNQGQAQRAIESYRRAVALKPAYVEARINLASALSETGSTDEAIEHLLAALRPNPLGPHASVIHFNLGVNYERKGRGEAALAEFERALLLNPNFAEARRRLELSRARQPAAQAPPLAPLPRR